MNKKQSKNSNENQDDENKSAFSIDESTQKENIEHNNDLDSRLDDIKKLASDFSMEDEGEVSPFSEGSENDLAEMGVDYLDRLSDLSQDESPFISDGEDAAVFGDRLDQISQNQPEQTEESIGEPEQKNQPPAFIPENLPIQVEQKVVKPRKKQKESVDDIEQDTESIMSQSQSNEEFVESIKTSLEDDEIYDKTLDAKPGDETVFTTEDRELDDSEIIQELENEINNADKATNPFLADQEAYESDDFLTNLDKLTIPETTMSFSASDLNQPENRTEEDHQISSSSWKDLLDSTDDDNDASNDNFLGFESESSFDEILEKAEGKPATEITGGHLDDGRIVDIDSPFDDLSSFEDESTLKKESTDGQSVDTLRRSFIDEFDQAAIDQENEEQTKKSWLPRTIENFNKWFKSLSLAEKILMFLSFIIGIAVIVSIVLVVTQWSINNRKITAPPSAIEVADADLIYPTGLELPGGWFFFLERGEIVENRWEPQNAEWLANTKLRRVVAIPWSNQSEEVVRSLTTEDEISIFMNNNDVVVYQVEEVLQISRDNVRILSDTEPSLVVLLFREDNEDRWTVIAKPKPAE